MDVIKECHDELIKVYPDLQVRWVRIYGKRWAHLWGSSSELCSHTPLKIKINQDYGLCIDNSELIPAADLEKVVNEIRERFKQAELV